jgi:ribonuclease BN (tRNA processing enzyme)
MRRVRKLILASVVPLLCACDQDALAVCPPDKGVAVQVLGSGGPIADDARASSGYLVWVDGKSRALIDAGGGTFLRFAEAGARFADLDFIGITHFHADHSAGLPAILKSGNFANRKRALAIAGPGGSNLFPGLEAFLEALLAREGGAFGYLSGYLDGSGNLPKLEHIEVDPTLAGGIRVYGGDGEPLLVDAIPVPHGIVPALAYRIQTGGMDVVITGDQNGGDESFIDFSAAADLLVVPMAVPEGVTGVGRRLHAPPGVIGSIAADAGVQTLVLSHFMQRSLAELDDGVELVRTRFGGVVEVAKDLACYRITNTED